VTGIDRADVGLMVFPRLDDCRRLAQLPNDASPAQIVAAPEVRAFFANLLQRLNRHATGSASHVARLCLLAQPPSLALGEMTDKGSINQRVVLKQRADVVAALHAAQGDSLEMLLAPR